MTAGNASNEIRITRLLDAPLQTVWQVWTDPAHLAKWWGPRGFTLTTHHKETKVGGKWRYTMHGPDGVDYENTTQYLEVVPLQKLVYDHGGHEDRPPLFRVTALFTDLGGGRTRLEMTMTLPTPEAAAETRKFIKKASGESTWDRLVEYLAKEISGADQFVIARSFNAPPAVIFDLWTSPDHLARWLPPPGFTVTFHQADVRAGGSSFYSMGNGSITFHGISRYLTIDRPNRLVYVQQFADEKGAISRHPLAPTWPESLLNTVIFAEEGTQGTRVTVISQPQGTTTPAELEAFLKMRGSMTHGWSSSFDKLDALADTLR